MNESNEHAYLALLHAWELGGADAVSDKIRELFTDATVWVQPGLPTATGPDEAIAIVQSWGAAFATFELEIRHVASTDDSVLVERVDIFRRDDGSTFLALPVVGVAEFRDGKITEWREYYDTAAVPGLNASTEAN
jgi:limonene-1,2-epoxide hydrolase